MAQLIKIQLQCRRPGSNPWVGKISWRREQLPTPVFWPGKFYGQRSLAGHNPWGHKELDMTEQLFGEGNGTPLQYSCLENPMDRGAWLATVHGVTKKESEATSLSPSKAFEELEVKSTLPAATWWQNHIFNQDWQQV